MKLPSTIGPIHFIGIGGIGMSGIAEMLCRLGYRVQGSDQADSPNVQRLRSLGINIVIGHSPDNLHSAAIIVVSSAIDARNCELAAARERRLPVVRRAEMLAELMRFKRAVAVAGSHGKTTTTSLVAALFDVAGLDPTAIIGGIVNAYDGGSARMGEGEFIIVEADESDGTFVKLPIDYAIVTNIDPEHLDHYGDFDALQAAFRRFAENVPFYGRIIMCADDANVLRLAASIEDREILTYGENPQSDIRITDIELADGGSRFSLELQSAGRFVAEPGADMSGGLAGLNLPMMGAHNIANAAAAAALALSLGISAANIRSGLARFGGVKRRFTLAGEVGGIKIYDDYAHHPVEISAVLKAARYSGKRVIAIMQPHRYTRLRDLFDEFCTAFSDAEFVVTTPVHSAGEEPIAGFDHVSLAAGIAARRHRDVRHVDTLDELKILLAELARPQDVIVCLGAGSITGWAEELPKLLAHRPEASRRDVS